MKAVALNIDTFWDAIRTGTLLLRLCADCRQVHFYPRVLCPMCHSDETGWSKAEGGGSIYSFTQIGREAKAITPALILLDEGVVVPGAIVGAEPARISIGGAVRLASDKHSTEPPCLCFAPADV